MPLSVMFFFFFKQKTAYEMRISDWSSDVCSSDLKTAGPRGTFPSPARRRPVAGPLPVSGRGGTYGIHTSLSPDPDRRPGQASVSERDPGPTAPLGAWPIRRRVAAGNAPAAADVVLSRPVQIGRAHG